MRDPTVARLHCGSKGQTTLHPSFVRRDEAPGYYSLYGEQMGILLLARGGLGLDRSNTAFRGLVHATVRAIAAPGELPLLDGHPLFFC